MLNKQKRLHIFKVGSRAISRYRNGDDSIYFCPLCGIGFPEDAAISGELSLEHVPTERMGGKGILLTCKKCNSNAGRSIDAHVANRLELEDFAKLVTDQSIDGSTRATLVMANQDVSISYSRVDGKTDIKVVGKASDPKKIDQIRSHIQSQTDDNGKWNAEFRIKKNFKLDERLAKIGYLKSAFLLITAWLGYRYAFDKRLTQVRNQIQNPNENTLDAKFWMVPQTESNFHDNTNCILSADEPISLFLVIFKKCAIILPNPSSPIDLYDKLNERWGKDKQVTFSGTFHSWPNKPEMHLDFFCCRHAGPAR